jgi:hypothetical protein
VLTDGHVVLTLLGLKVGQPGKAFGRAVTRVDKRRWAVAGGEAQALLAAADRLMFLTGHRPVNAEDLDEEDER